MNKWNREQWYALRWSAFERDGYKCRYCGQEAPNVVLWIRVVDESTGLDGLITTCTACKRGWEPQDDLPKMRKLLVYLAFKGIADIGQMAELLGTARANVYRYIRQAGSKVEKLPKEKGKRVQYRLPHN